MSGISQEGQTGTGSSRKTRSVIKRKSNSLKWARTNTNIVLELAKSDIKPGLMTVSFYIQRIKETHRRHL